MDLLGLLRGGGLSRPNGPDRLVGQDDPIPVFSVLDVVRDGLQLSEADLLRLPGLALFQLFADAGNDLEPVFQGKSNLKLNKGPL